MKKIIVFIVVVMLFSFNTFSFVYAGESPIYINGIKYLGKSTNINGRFYISLSDMKYNIGVISYYDKDTDKISFKRADLSFFMKLNSNVIYINGSSIIMDAKPQIIDDEIFIPVKYLAEALGYTIIWDDTIKSVNINTNGIMIGSGTVSIPLDRVDLNKVNCNKVYDEDYIDIELFNKMFSKGWKIVDTKKYLSEDLITDENTIEIYTRWKIQYKDNENKDRMFYISNADSLAYNINNIILNHINTYYTEYLFDDLDKDNIECSIDFSFTGNNVTTSASPGIAYKRYIEKICTKEDVVDISSLNIKNTFKMLPVYCCINIKYSNSDLNNTAYSYAYKITNKINTITDYTANFVYCISCNKRDIVKKYYINGKEYIGSPNVLKYMSDLTYDIYKYSFFAY